MASSSTLLCLKDISRILEAIFLIVKPYLGLFCTFSTLTCNYLVAYNYVMKEDDIFKALADPTRRLILDEFAQRSVQTLFELCGRLAMKHNVAMSRQAITKHIQILEEAGLVRSEMQGKYRILRFDSQPIKHITSRWTTNGE
jgi:DNA-binding transcriptional ArsR family regulator